MPGWNEITQRLYFRSRTSVARVAGWGRGLVWRLAGLQVGAGTFLPRIEINWPHQVSLGAGCILEPGIVFRYDGIWKPGPAIVVGDGCFIGRGCEFNISSGIRIESRALIAAGCKFIDHDHGHEDLEGHLGQLMPNIAPIHVGAGAWLGYNVVVLRGVTIGRGAIVGAGAVVTRSIPPHETWAGVPARCLRTAGQVG